MNKLFFKLNSHYVFSFFEYVLIAIYRISKTKRND